MLPNLNDLVRPISEKIEQFDVLDCSLPISFTSQVTTIYRDTVRFGKSSSCITNRNGQRIYLSNNWFYIAAILAPLHQPFYQYKRLLNKIVDKEVLKQSDPDRIKLAINNRQDLDEQDKVYLIKFALEPLWWNGGNSNTGGKSLDRNDALVSSVLSIANLVNASQSYVATLWEYFGEHYEYAEMLQSAANDILNSTEIVNTIIGRSPTAQIIYYGCPGTGKSRTVKEKTEGLDDEKIISYDDPELPTNVYRTTFHPDYDYATFVGCYKPVKDDNGLDYKFIPQVFTKAYATACLHHKDPVYLIIEEINRGNCAQIFGDLFQLLDRKKDGESEYPIVPDSELSNYLKTKGVVEYTKLSLPANLHIYATMNTSDQSLFPMDSAFKRRWAMEYVPIKYEKDKAKAFTITLDSGKTYKWVDFLKAINEKISFATDSEDKQMGEFFIKSSVTSDEFKNKVMFYLWSEICKDLYSAKGSGQKYFMRIEEQKADPQTGNTPPDQFTFSDLFTDRNRNDALLESFFIRLGLHEVGKQNITAEQPETDPVANE